MKWENEFIMKKSVVKNVCIYGAGGVGGYFGGKICLNQQSDHSINFIARGDHLSEIREKGLILNAGDDKGLVCMPDMATDCVDDLPDIDLFLICVKSYDLINVIDSIAHKVRDNTIVLPLLNGVDIYDRIRAHLDTGIVLPACVYVGTHIEKPGVVTQKGGDGVILCGPDPRVKDFNYSILMDFFENVDIKFYWDNDPYPAIWSKFIFIASFGLVCAKSGKTLGQVLDDEVLKNSTIKIMEEIKDIADAKNIELPEDIIEQSLKKASTFPYDVKTSYQRDVETRGKQNEGNIFGEAVIKMADKLNMHTPFTRSFYYSIESICE